MIIMGCFNSTCSLSHLDVTYGDKCYFLILKPNRFHEKLEGSTICYPDERYKLFCLPIVGEYNDYGRIEEIQKDEHILFLEKKLDMSIESLIEIAAETRNVYEDLSEKFQQFIDNKEIFKNPASLCDIFIKLNFKSIGENKYIITSDLKLENEYMVEVQDKENYTVFKDGVKLYSDSFSFHNVSDFFNRFQEKTGIYLNIKKRKIFNMVKDLCSCFVLKEVADNLMKEKSMFKHWRYKSVNDWDFTPGLATYIGFQECEFGKYIATKNGETFVLQFSHEKIIVNGKEISNVRDFKSLTKSFNEEIKNMGKELTQFDLEGYNFKVGARAKFSIEREEYSIYYFHRFYESSWVFRLNIPMMELYTSEFENWSFESEYVTAKKLLHLFHQTHNMLEPTCNASQDDMKDYVMTLYKIASNYVKECRRREKEEL